MTDYEVKVRLFSVNRINIAINNKTRILKYLAKILNLLFEENFLWIKSENKMINPKTINVITIKINPNDKIWNLKGDVSE